MAREYGRIWLSVWSDPAWKALDSRAQWLYMALVTQPGISTAGVQAFAPNKWAQLATDLTPRIVLRSTAVLERASANHAGHGMLVVDRNTDEVLIRTYVRYDKPMKVPNVAVALVRRINEIVSDDLRKVALDELDRMRTDPEFAKLPGWKVPELEALMALHRVA